MIEKERYGVHARHCCIEHGCKYSAEDCPVMLGLVQQEHICDICEYCDDEIREGEVTEDYQKEYINALWEEKQSPKIRGSVCEKVVILAKKYGRYKLMDILKDVIAFGEEYGNVRELLEILETLKEIK